MNKTEMKTLAASLWLLIPNLVRTISLEKNIDFLKAAELLYNSKLFKVLQDTRAKAWHFSELTLADILYKEMETGEVEFPDVGY